MRTRELKRRLKELVAQCKAEPGSIPRRLELAAALREAGRGEEAIDLYRGAAEAYASDGRLVQAMAVCKGILEIDPSHEEAVKMLSRLATAEAQSFGLPTDEEDDEPTRVHDTLPIVKLPFEPLISDEDSATHEVRALIDDFPRLELTTPPPPFPLLSDLPAAAFGELLQRLTVLRLSAGEMVLREGEAGDACFLIAAGRARVEKAGVSVAVLEPGTFFGEFAVLADQRRHASVVALEPLELLEIRRALLDEIVARYPSVQRTLRQFYRERLLSTLMSTAPFFSALSGEERARVVDRFLPRRYALGAEIIGEGQRAGGFHLILVGEVEVSSAGKDGEHVLAKLGEGSYFGEMSLLRGKVACATVRATRVTETAELSPRDFYAVASELPIVWDELRQEAQRRELANHAIFAGEAWKGDEFYLV